MTEKSTAAINSSDKLEEYKLIREEINKESDGISTCRSVLFATTAAVLAFAFTQDNPLVFLIPYVVIIPLSSIENDHLTGIVRKGTYLLVFCEEYLDIEWERRLLQADVRNKKIKKHIVSHYLLMTLCCLTLAVIHLDFSDMKSRSLWTTVALITGFTVITVIFVEKNRVNYLDEKLRQMKMWQDIKKLDKNNLNIEE